MDSAPLLSAIGGLPQPHSMQDHPAFLRACHSPWKFIPQNILVILRGVLLAFIVATGAMIIHAKLHEESEYSNWRHIFDFAVCSYFLVFIYHLITFSWTFTHLYYPHQEDYDGVESWIVAAMSLPSNMANLRKQFYFTMFYTATVVACFMNSTIYWFATRPHELGAPSENNPPQDDDSDGQNIFWYAAEEPSSRGPFSDIFGEGWFNAYVIVALYALSSAIMVIEIFWLNSIKRPIAIGAHVFGLIFLAGLYLGWAAIGHLLTDWYPFFWLDDDQVGSQEAVSAYCIGFVSLAPTMYTLMQGFIGIREGLTRSLSEARATAAAQEALES